MPAEEATLQDTKAVQHSLIRENADIKNGRVSAKYMGTVTDRHDMRLLGKEQVLRVRLLY